MKILFTGTGSGKTSLERYHSSFLISVQNYNLLVDTGDSVSRALLSSGITYNSINGIVITHFHPDHFSGFASLIVQMKMSARREPLSVYVHTSLINTLHNFLLSAYIFTERLGFELRLSGFEFDDKIQLSDNMAFTARRNTHLNEYKEHESDVSLASASLLFSSGNKRVFYSGDLGSGDDLDLFNDNHIDLFITEAMHVSLETILERMDRIDPGKIILTHVDEEDVIELKKRLEKTGAGRIIIAEDGMNLSVSGYSG